jgi:hypothetical protein
LSLGAISVRSGGADARSLRRLYGADGRSLRTGWKPCARIRVLRTSLPSKGLTDTFRNIGQPAIQLESTHRRMHDSTNEVRVAIEWHRSKSTMNRMRDTGAAGRAGERNHVSTASRS